MERNELIPFIVVEGFGEPVFVQGDEFPEALPYELKGFLKPFGKTLISGSFKEGADKLKVEPFFVYIYSSSGDFLRETLTEIRKNSRFSLVPVFTKIKADEGLPVDGVFSGYSKEIPEKATGIWNILFSFEPVSYPENTPEYRKIVYLRYLYSRGIEEEKPQINRHSKYAFSWKTAELFMEPKEEGGEFDSLESMRHLKLLSGNIADKTSLCPGCGYYNLIFKEVCPNCGSIRIEVKEFIHHYPCGYIGPVDEFISDDKLVCPKCHEELKHIGVDYDKTMEQFYCMDCNTSFTEPDINVTCANCSKNWKPEDIITRYVYSYGLTSFGKTVAIEGKIPLSLPEEVSKILGTVSYDVFKLFLRKYTSLVKRYNNHRFCLLGITLDIDQSVYNLQPIRLRSIVKSILEVIRDNLRETDVVSFIENRYILILLAESTDEGVNVVKARIDNLMNSIITDNNVGGIVKFSTATLCVPSQEGPLAPEELINRLMSKL